MSETKVSQVGNFRIGQITLSLDGLVELVGGSTVQTAERGENVRSLLCFTICPIESASIVSLGDICFSTGILLFKYCSFHTQQQVSRVRARKRPPRGFPDIRFHNINAILPRDNFIFYKNDFFLINQTKINTGCKS